MRTAGLVGGVGWTSLVRYYEILNRSVANRLGGIHSAKCVMYSLDYDQIRKLEMAGSWPQIAELLLQSAHALKAAGAEVFVLCCNTLHAALEPSHKKLPLPLLHICDSVVDALGASRSRCVGLLGTSITLQHGFYSRHISAAGYSVLLPPRDAISALDEIIYEELSRDVRRSTSKVKLLNIIENMTLRGANAVVLACTELGFLLESVSPTEVLIVDSTVVHANAVARWMCDSHD